MLLAVLKVDPKIYVRLDKFFSENETLTDPFKDTPRFHEAYLKAFRTLSKDMMKDADTILHKALKHDSVKDQADVVLKNIGAVIFDVLDPTFVNFACGACGAFFAEDADPKHKDNPKLKAASDYWATAGKLESLTRMRPVYGILLVTEFVSVAFERFVTKTDT